MNRSNASRSKAVSMDGPELNGVQKTSLSRGQVKNKKPSAAKSTPATPVTPASQAAAAGVAQVQSSPAQAKQNPLGQVHHSQGHHSQGHHSHVHDDESIRQIVNRLSRIEGHVRGLKRMVQDQENCPDVLIQVAAVRGALDKVARLILDEHLTQCVLRAAAQGNIEAEIAELQAALNRFLP